MNDTERLKELIFLKLGLDLTRKDTQYPLVPAKDLAQFYEGMVALLDEARLDEIDKTETVPVKYLRQHLTARKNIITECLTQKQEN